MDNLVVREILIKTYKKLKPDQCFLLLKKNVLIDVPQNPEYIKFIQKTQKKSYFKLIKHNILYKFVLKISLKFFQKQHTVVDTIMKIHFKFVNQHPFFETIHLQNK